MELITFRCTSCNQGLKVGADKAGRRIKCTKCGTPLTVPAASPKESAAPAKPAPAAKPGGEDEDEDGGGIYSFEGTASAPQPAPPSPRARPPVEEDDEEQDRPAARRARRFRDEEEDEDEDEDEYEEDEDADEALRQRLMGDDEEDDDDEDDDEGRPPKKRGPRAKLDPVAWGRVRVGLLLAVIAVGLLAGSALLHGIYVLIGVTAGNQYAKAILENHPNYGKTGDSEVVLSKLVVAMVGGTSGFDANLVLARLSQVLALLQDVVMIAACVFCLAAPGGRFGTKGLVIATLSVVFVSLIVGMVFKLLPLTGAMKFTLVPLLGAELPLLDAETDRLIPLQLLWGGGSPYAQVLLTLLVILVTNAGLVLFPLFLRAVGQWVKSDPVEDSAVNLARLTLAVVFAQVAYQLLAMTGTSEVLQIALKVIYGIGLGFFAGQVAWYIVLLLRSRSAIETALERQEML
jgi:hypothetical protein